MFLEVLQPFTMLQQGGEVDVNKRNHEDDLRCATWAFFEEKELRGPTRNYILYEGTSTFVLSKVLQYNV